MELHKYTIYLGLPGSLFGYVQHPIFRKIEELGELNNGWHFGAGTAPSAGVLAIATQVASKAISLGVSELDAFPGKSGEVTIAIYVGEEDHSFQTRQDLSLRYWSESDPDSEIEEGLSLADVTKKIAEIARAHPPWNLFYTSTFDSGTLTSGISEARPSTTPATEAGYPLLISTVYGAESAGVYANMLVGITRPLALSPQFSGDLANQSCQPATR